MQKGEKYVVIADRETGLEWGRHLQETMATCSNMKQAYNVGLHLARIETPSLNYRKAMFVLNETGACSVKDGDKGFIVVRVKNY